MGYFDSDNSCHVDLYSLFIGKSSHESEPSESKHFSFTRKWIHR